jgi:hypothetical protein
MRTPAGPPDLLTALSVGGYHMNEIQIRPHTQTTAVSIQTTLSHFGSGSLLGPISYWFAIWRPSHVVRAASYLAAS